MSSAHSTLAASIAAPPRASSTQEEWPPTSIIRDNAGWVLLGNSPATRQLRSQIQRIAPYLRTALIHGEAGCGKQVIARAIHAHSPGKSGPFVIHDSCALADAAASARSPIKLAAEIAVSTSGGTLHLTRLSELNFTRQASLLHFLEAFDEHRSIQPNQRRNIARTAGPGILLLAQSNHDLRALAAIGQFRQDLYARLSAVEIHVAPLRQRSHDIAEIAASILERIANVTAQNPKRVSHTTRILLEERPWPGNLRELEQVIARAAALSEGDVIEPHHLLAPSQQDVTSRRPAPTPKHDQLEAVIERHVFDVLTRCGGNKVRAADVLGISRSTLYRMIGTQPRSSPPAHPSS